MTRAPRYDGVADWYDTEFQPDALTSEQWETLVRFLGEPAGSLLDVGCGTGAYAVGLIELGWDVTGVDASEDMLRRAHAKGVKALRADAAALPFEAASFDAAISMFTHTDFEDLPAALREVGRVLRPGAPFVYLGPHPCFVGPHSEYVRAQGVPTFHEGWYRRIGAYDEAPGRSGAGLRERIGTSFHRPLGEFLQTFLDAGFRLERVEEPEQREYAYTIATRWRR
jgi:ubiquinone/menaquinone biosynthesis C-methylase UbiE